MGKTFSTTEVFREPERETLSDTMEKRPLRFRDEDHRLHYEAEAATKDEWFDWALVTLIANSDRVTPKTFFRLWRKTLADFNESYPSEKVRYRLVANRGPTGVERASAHLNFAFDPDVGERVKA